MRFLYVLSCSLLLMSVAGCGLYERWTDEPYYPPNTSFKTNIAASFGNAEIQKVAVLIENKSGEGYDPLVQTVIEGYLSSTKGYQVVSRSRMDQILEEQGAAVQDFTEEPGRLGAILNAQALIFVELGKCEGRWLYKHDSLYPRCDLNATMVSIDTGETLYTSIGELWGVWNWETSGDYYLDYFKLVLEDLPRAHSKGSRLASGLWKGRAYGPNGEAALMAYDLRAKAPNGDRIIRITASETADGEPVEAGFFWGFVGSDEKSGAWPEDRDGWISFRASNPGESLGESDQCWAELKRRSPILYEGNCWSVQGVQTRFEMEEP
jgi:hypothetical protein